MYYPSRFSICVLFLVAAATVHAQKPKPYCEQQIGHCVDLPKTYTYDQKYVGHGEPSLLFYSNKPGSGNSSTYFLRLPKDPPTLPKQNGTGGTFNFQLHPAFWVGIASSRYRFRGDAVLSARLGSMATRGQLRC